ncbi:MAG: hypothetical protein WDM89_19385 [Rhizomicrobium sp.]
MTATTTINAILDLVRSLILLVSWSVTQTSGHSRPGRVFGIFCSCMKMSDWI